ncbi:PAS domain-containing protein [Colwellia sp. BRX10-3]|uniref:sensor histidine kinase n=1 Tax=Colwellia sp. BRX10-3 TaxID=2759844 RepID=UPI0015F6E5AF|nr:ATP-binding protein [Colwellia sp. BRX10-3]MBA6389456.1 PAS domain-containing protein [Colwellia sp. BRX10-3]
MALAYSTSTNSSSANPVLNRVLTSFDEVNVKRDQPNRLESENYAGELAFLRQQNKQLQHVIDVMPTGMIMLDGNGIVVKMNDTAQRLLDEPILGQPWFNVIKRSFKPRADDWHEVSLNDGRRVKLEITALGGQPGQLIMITDLTETRLLQDKLGQLQRLSSLGRMVSKLAHQIRTPLSAAMLYGANLRNKKLNDDARVNFQDKLMLRLQDLEQQVNDMLLFAKSGSKAVVEPINVNQLIEQATQAIEPQVNQAGAKVNLYFSQQGCEILGNVSALTGAIHNLIHNSLSVIKTDAVIDMSAYCQGEYAYISVRDNGPGISAEQADKIFEPFYTSRSQGTGLGLAVVKSVTNAHQGEVSLISKPGEGAHFCIKLPLLVSENLNTELTENNNNAFLSKELSNEHK